MNIKPCPNLNHRETNRPVGFCFNFGKVVNERILVNQYSGQSHTTARRDSNKYCVGRSEKLRYSVCDVRDIARKMFESQFSWFDHSDSLIVEGAFPKVRVYYVCAKASYLDHRTFLDCRFHFDCGQMWIGSIQVAACHRRHGVGRQLVAAAEATAAALGMKQIRILPTPAAVEFWMKLEFCPAPRLARVMWKSVSSVAP